MDFSIIIPVTRKDLINTCLQSLLRLDYPKNKFEVILILKEKYQNLPKEININQIEIQDTNPALRRNIGVKNAKTPYIAFIDDDVTVPKDWLKNSKKLLEKYPDIGGLGGPDCIPENASFSERITDSLLAHKYFGSGVLAHTYYKQRKIIKQPSSLALCNLIIRKELFDKLYFNEKIGYGGEDTEFVYLLQEKYNIKFLYDPSIYVFHKRRNFGLSYFKQRLKFRINNGKMMYVYPKLYLKNKKFFLFFIGITFGILLFFTNLRIFLIALIFYFLILAITSLSFIKKDIKIFLLLPVLLFIQHITYYIGIVIGMLSFYKYKEIRKIKRI